MFDIAHWRTFFWKERWLPSRTPTRLGCTLEQLGAALTFLRPRPEAKGALDLWSPTQYAPDTKRGSDNVVSLSCLVLDYDDGCTIDDAWDRWDSYAMIVHTTWGHTAEHHRFRVVLPLAQPIAREHWAAVWAWGAEQSGQQVDPSCKDPARMYYVPCQGDNARAMRQDGALLDLSHLRVKPPVRRQRREIATAHRVDQTDPAWRRWAGEQVGGRLVSDAVRHAPCPRCGRPEVHWPFDAGLRTFAKCNRENSCGWYGLITEVLEGRK